MKLEVGVFWGMSVGLIIQHVNNVFLLPPIRMSSEVQPRPDDSPNTSGGSSDAEQRDVAPSVQPEEREREREREQAPPKKKEAKFSSKTPAKLSTSAKRWATATRVFSRSTSARSHAVPSSVSPYSD